MSRLFRTPATPEIPAPVPPPPVPTVDNTTRAREDVDRIRRRRGRSASIFTGSQGAGIPQTSAATLLGG